LIESIFEDGGNGFVEVAIDAKSTGCGCFETFRGVLFGQSEDSERGAETLLRVGSAVKDMGDELFGVGADLGGPAEDA
jgi:hypothetical protein